MTVPPASGGWRLAAGCLAAVAVVATFAVWRSLHTDGAWLLAVQLTAALAVLGLLVSIWLALRPSAGTELVLRVSEGSDGPTTEKVKGGPGQADDDAGLRRALAVALLTVAPFLLVAVLAVPAEARDTETAPTSNGSPSATAAATGELTQSPSESAPTDSESAPTGPSPTETATTEPAPSEPSPTESSPEPAPEPTEPEAPPPSGAAACPAGGAPVPYEVVAGDTLWDIAERSLLGSGTLAEIDAEWRQLYERNVDTIGPDPDLVLPRQVLLACR